MSLHEILRVRISGKLYKWLCKSAKDSKRTLPDYVRIKLEEVMEKDN